MIWLDMLQQRMYPSITYLKDEILLKSKAKAKALGTKFACHILTNDKLYKQVIVAP